MEPVAAPLWLRGGLRLLVRTATFAQLLGLLEQLVEIELSDNVLLWARRHFILVTHTRTTHLVPTAWPLFDRVTYFVEVPGHGSSLLVHHWPPHDLLASLEKHQRRELFGQR